MSLSILSRSDRLKKQLRLVDVFAIATGTSLSAGFFLLPGLAAAEIGAALPLAYLIAAIPLIPAMFSKIELATAMPRAGGVYYFLDRSMGSLVGTIGGLGTWLALSLKASFALIGMGAYVNLFMPNIPMVPLAVVLAILFGIVNLFGAKSAGVFQLVLVGGLCTILAWFCGGVIHVNPDHFAGFFEEGFDSLLGAAGLVYISYVGITKVASVSEEVKDPEKNLPRGVFLSFCTVLTIYVIGTTVMVGVVPMSELSGDLTPVATAARHLAGPTGAILIVIAALLAFTSVANAGILSASRYPLAMSRDKLVPPWLGKMTKRGIPRNGVLITVGLILFFLVAFNPIKIAKLASSFQLLLFAMNCLAVIVMRESRIESYDPGFRSPFYPYMQIAGIIAPFFLITQMGSLSIVFTCALVACGTGWYFYYGRHRSQRSGAIYHIFERLVRRRHHGLDAELRGIMKEKGLREADPFNDIVARAAVLDLTEPTDFESIAKDASDVLDLRVPVSSEHLLGGFLKGTRTGATPVSHGAALPHFRIPGIPHPELVLVRCQKPIHLEPIEKTDDKNTKSEPIHSLFFLVSPEENPGQHLRILAQIAERIDDDDFPDNWQDAKNDQALKESLLRNGRFLAVPITDTGPTASLIGCHLAELQFPNGCLVVLVRRAGTTFVPGKHTQIRKDDRITVIGDPNGIQALATAYVPENT